MSLHSRYLPGVGGVRPRQGLASGTTRQRVVPASQERVWEVLADPTQLRRWWPGTQRVVDQQDDRWTQVFMSKRGRPVRADFHLLASEPPSRRCWAQDVVGTPFERVLAESSVEITLAPSAGGTLVTIAQRQKLRGYSRTGGLILRRATARRLDEALEGLAHASAER